ncbi:MAG: SOS response-associated peptidase [Longimicrobiales bacterium]|nr:SOS response-associated peptidase [Longimicrobiales bacterium]
MCGRYTLTADMSDLERLDWYDELLSDHQPRYNIAPTQDAPVIARNKEGVRGLLDMRWGLVPFWADDPEIGNRMINARSETARSKPAFRAAFQSRRCLVLTDGFYEWKEQNGGPKQPFWIHEPEDSVFAFAGLWESWKEDEEDDPLLTFTILTRDAREDLRSIHARMPVILDAAGRETWLGQETSPDTLEDLLEEEPTTSLQARPVSTYVNKPGNTGPECIEAVED